MDGSFLIAYAPQIVITALLLSIGWHFGSRAERKHFAYLNKQEQALADITMSSERLYKPNSDVAYEPLFVRGNVVIAQDYFKMIVANIFNFFGKNLTTYETLLERARKEAVVRMKQQAKEQGYTHIYGVRLETTNIGQGGQMVEVIAYGTAVSVV